MNKIKKLISIENAKYGAASDSSRKGQNFFCKKFKIILQSHASPVINNDIRAQKSALYLKKLKF